MKSINQMSSIEENENGIFIKSDFIKNIIVDRNVIKGEKTNSDILQKLEKYIFLSKVSYEFNLKKNDCLFKKTAKYMIYIDKSYLIIEYLDKVDIYFNDINVKHMISDNIDIVYN